MKVIYIITILLLSNLASAGDGTILEVGGRYFKVSELEASELTQEEHQILNSVQNSNSERNEPVAHCDTKESIKYCTVHGGRPNGNFGFSYGGPWAILPDF